MNELNVASFEASKKLYGAGIVLETEAGWYKIFRPGCHAFEMVLSMRSGNEKFFGDNYPAPSMAELWRELPETLDVVDIMKPHSYIRMTKFQGETVTGYGCQLDIGKRINPADALIELLIWLRKEASHEIDSHYS